MIDEIELDNMESNNFLFGINTLVKVADDYDLTKRIYVTLYRNGEGKMFDKLGRVWISKEGRIVLNKNAPHT
ncbi:MAG: hypothetical protein ACI86M_000680 [Saprospiraceae bacterium]|jgi:hypothetical protein